MSTTLPVGSVSSSSSSSSNSQLKLIKTLWGIDEPISAHLFESIRKEGYHGVEVIRLAWALEDGGDALVQLLNHAGLAVVCQIHTAGGYLRDGEYMYCDSYDISRHEESFQQQLEECRLLIQKVDKGGFVNVHAGVDAWSTKEAWQFLTFALTEIGKLNIHVTFETHRQRLFGSPFQTRDILCHHPAENDSHDEHQQQKQQQQLVNCLKINADLSHWYCACERVFDPTQPRDAPWWPDLLETLAKHSHYIHARYGWSQGPQMPDPSALECQAERLLQTQTWKVLLSAMKKRQGKSDCFVSPEYGPAPYLLAEPRTQKPMAVLSEAVAYTKIEIEKLFCEI